MASIGYVEFYYASVMPRSPQPQTGRIYQVDIPKMGIVYVTKREATRRDFVWFRIMPAYGLTMLLFAGLSSRYQWYKPKLPWEN
jgi:hypothetical protein